MAKLTKADILHVASLAKIEISDAEVEKYSEQLSKVVDYFSALSEVDTKNIEPTNQTTGLENVTRSDLVKTENCLTQDEAVSGSDEIYNGYFKVKAILTERTDK
ncbi:MAG: Asp-tRNA(Asn)/Glu-tRNA(Gln) amidotransferase subunit GatC [Candidatus Woesebacteria bacterium]|nr:Asp-tRNA(Asn)/Glu-tRNA(Gln) amidotransferase subunit GatC [Candidatus Woesebacteria bacterium]